MLPPMRRKDRAQPENQAWKALAEGVYGTMATMGADGWPYAVPLSYVVIDGAIYFHCAAEGRKLANVNYLPKVCFSVVKSVQAVYTKNFTTYYESVTAFGTVAEVCSEREKTDILMKLAEKYLPDFIERAPSDIAKALSRTSVYKITVKHLSGKQHLPARS